MEKFHLYAILLALPALLYACIHRITSRKKTNLPPSPPTLPIIGNLHQLGPLAHRSLRDLSRIYGPAMHLKFGSKPVLVVSSSDYAKEIMKTHDLAFAGKPVLSAPRKIFYDLKDPINLPYGAHWRKLRSIFMHELLGSSRVKSFNSIREEASSLLVEEIRKSASAGASVNLTEMFLALANDLICRAALGKRQSETRQGKKVVELADKVGKLLFNFTVGEFVPWLSWLNWLNGYNAELEECAREIDETMSEIVEEQLSTVENKGSFVEILVGIYKGNVPGVSIDLTSAKAVILDTFGAGTETSARTMVWIMAELIKNPDVMKKLQDEVREVTKGKPREISEDDLQKMHYLKAVIKETFRFHPPVAIYFHSAREYVNLKGYDIEPETMVLINAWAIGRDPAIWKEPENFMPERFLDSSVDYRGFNYELIPFGAGRRICPGIGFASMSIEHTMANLMRNFDFALPCGVRGEDLDVSERPGFTIGKKEPLIVVPSIV